MAAVTVPISDALAASIITQVSPSVARGGPSATRGPQAKLKRKPEDLVPAVESEQGGQTETPPLPSGVPVPPLATTSVSAPPAASTSAAVAPQTTKKKQRSPMASFFRACLPCLANDAHDDPVPSPKNDSTRSSNEKESLNEKSKSGPVDSSSPPSIVPVVAASAAALTAAAVVANTTRGGAVLSQEDTEGVTSGAVVPPGKESGPVSAPKPRRRRSGKAAESIITSVPEPGQTYDEDSEDDDEDEDGEEEEDEEQALIARGGVGIPIGEDGLPHPLLEPLASNLTGRKCLVLDLDETLVHSSFKMIHQADYVVPVEIDSQFHNVYVIKRPGVDNFLKAMGEIYEVVIFTASLSKYADPVLDQLDIHRVVQHRLFRESCYNNKGNYVKDLSQLGRPMSECIIIDNSPASYVFHVNNAVPISSWFNDPHDTELTDLIPFLTDLERVDDIRSVLDAGLYQA